MEISIYVDRAHQNRGIGQLALHFAEQQLAQLKIETVLAFIFDVNQASQRLFRKNGYEKWGHLPNVANIDGSLVGLDILGKRYE